MPNKNRRPRANRPKTRSIVELHHQQARAFLLKHESYCTIDLPPYFRFDKLLRDVAKELQSKSLSSLWSKRPRNYDHINHPLMHNKDGRFAWRRFEFIHPALYVELVNNITDPANWKLIQDRFASYVVPRIRCLSVPVTPPPGEKDKAAQISQWWHSVEQQSIELSLDYGFIAHTDITDCYAAIYSHSIAWALHTKPIAKNRRNDKKLIGNIIDAHIQDMRQGQTNGISQGSVLMDLIAEMILGYSDTELAEKVKNQGVTDYEILRFRDDYRIFVNNPQDGEIILKCLTETMIDLGLKLNPAKTRFSGDVITSSLKDDKLSWLFRKQGDSNIRKQLLIIRDHSMAHPNSGSLEVALNEYHRRISRLKRGLGFESPTALISIIVDIAYRNPRTYPVSAAVLSCLLDFLGSQGEKQRTIERIRMKFSQIPNPESTDSYRWTA